MKSTWKVSFAMAFVVVGLGFIFLSTNSGQPSTSRFLNNVYEFSDEIRESQPRVVPGIVVVKLKPIMEVLSLHKGSAQTGVSSLDDKLTYLGAKSVEKMFRHKPIPQNSNIPDISRFLKVRIPDSSSPTMVAQKLGRDPNVEYAEPVYVREILTVPNDSLYSEQHYLPQILAPEAWDIQKGDSNVVIAILDTGTDYEHEDLKANVWTNELEANGVTGVDDDDNGFIDDAHGWDFVDDDPDPMSPPPGYPMWFHGTLCTGMACAVTNNEIEVAGSSWNCKFMPIRACYSTYENAFKAIVYAVDNGADIISNSWGGPGFLKREQEIINYAHSKGAIIVCSAGNFNYETKLYPACYQRVINVASVRIDDIRAGYSAFGPAVDISAPGGDYVAGLAVGTSPGNTYMSSAGTSLAYPCWQAFAA